MPRRELKSVVSVNDYDTIHPALDFWKGIAIVSIGSRWQETYSVLNRDGEETSTEVRFTSNPLCVMSNGDKFRYTKDELAKRRLFYSGKLELSERSRWSYKDIFDYSEKPTCRTFPELYQSIQNEFKHFMDFADEYYYSLLSCFVIYTYFYPLFSNAPVLQLWGELQTGKTKICALLEAMIFNPVNSANISSASVFRLTESRRATIIFDESEDLMTMDRSREIRNMLLAGTGKSGEAYRQEKDTKDSFRTQAFRIFSPKIVANITGVDMPALLSRIIRVTTSPTKNREKENRYVDLEDKRWEKIRSELYRICLEQFSEVIKTRDSLSEGSLAGRTFHTWEGILTIAKMVDDNIFSRLVQFAQENKAELEAEIEGFNDEPQAMLEKLTELVSDGRQLYTSEELFGYLKLEFDISSKRGLGLRLGKLGIKSKILRIDGNLGRYYSLTKERLLQKMKS